MLTKKVFSISRNFKNVFPLVSLSMIHYKHTFTLYSDEAESIPTKVQKTNRRLDEISNLIVNKRISRLIKNEYPISSYDVVAVVSKSLNRYVSSNLAEENLQIQNFIKELCNFINKYQRVLSISQSITILDLSIKLMGPSSSTIVSSILFHLSSLLDTASLQECILIYNKLYKFNNTIEWTRSRKRLYQTLKNRIIQEITEDFDENDLQFICHALKFAIYSHNKEIINISIKALQKHSLENISVSQSIRLIKLLASIRKKPSEYSDIIHKIEDQLIHNDKKINCYQACQILNEMGLAYRIYPFYNETLVDNCIETLISSDIDLYHAIQILSNCNIIRHINKRLLNFVCDKFHKEYILKNINGLTKNQFFTRMVLVILTGLSLARYKSSIWEDLCKIFDTDRILKLKYETLVIMALEMACLDYFNPYTLDKIFTFDYNFRNQTYLFWTYLKVWQKIKTIPNYEGPEPSEKIVKNFIKIKQRKSYLLLSSLEQALGGSMYLKIDLRTKLYHDIDYVVAFRNGGYPIAISDPETKSTSLRNINYIEDLEVPSNCQIVAIMETPVHWYSQNTRELLGIFSIYLETIEASSCCKVIAISTRDWLEMSENLRVPFLMNQINSKLDYPHYA